MSIEVETVEEIKANMEAAKAAPEDKALSGLTESRDSEENISHDKAWDDKKEEPKKAYSDKFKESYEKLNEREREAWSQGWRPQELFAGKNRDGSPREWSDAETFLSKAKEALPVANDRLKELSKEIEKAKKEAALARKMAKEAEERGYKKAQEELLKKQEEAVEIGDLDSFRELRKREAELMQSRQEFTFEEEEEAPQEPQNSQLSQVDQMTINQWINKNTWFKEDKRMAAYATQVGMDLAQQFPYSSLEDRLEMVEQDVKETFRSKFKIETTRSGSYESGSSLSGVANGSSKEKGYNDLPNNAKNDCEKLIKMRGIEGDKAKAFRSNFAQSHFKFN